MFNSQKFNAEHLIQKALLGMCLSSLLPAEVNSQTPDHPSHSNVPGAPEKVGSKLRDVDPVVSLVLSNPSKTKFSVVKWPDFNPIVSKEYSFDASALRVANLVAIKPILNLQGTVSLDDPSTIGDHEGFAALASYLQQEYLPKHPQVLTEAGITDVKNLTPREAVLLTSSIVMHHIKYSPAQIKEEGRILNDSMPIEQILRWDQGESGNGVCRNYCSLASGILESLKLLQTSPSLNSTFMLYLSDDGRYVDNPPTPGSVANHAWSVAITFTEAEAVCAVLDLTWSDDESVSQDKTPKVEDFSVVRPFTALELVRLNGLVEPADMAKQLIQLYSTTEAVDASYFEAERLYDTFGAMPVRMQCADRIFQLASRHTLLRNEIRSTLEQIGAEQVLDLQTYYSGIQKAKRLLGGDAYSDLVLLPILRAAVTNARIAYAVEDKKTLSRLADFRTALSSENKNLSIECRLSEVELGFLTSDRAEGMNVVKYYQAHFPDFNLVKKETAVSEFFLSLVNRVSSGEREIVSAALQEAGLVGQSPKLSDALGVDLCEQIHSIIQAEDLEDLHIVVSNNADYARLFDEGMLVFHDTSTLQAIRQQIANHVSVRERLKSIRQTTPAKLEKMIVRAMPVAGSSSAFLRNIETYFCDPNRASLLRYRWVQISDRPTMDESHDPYTHVILQPEMFEVGHFDPEAIDTILRKNDRAKRLDAISRLDIERKCRDAFPIAIEDLRRSPAHSDAIYTHLREFFSTDFLAKEKSRVTANKKLEIVVADKSELSSWGPLVASQKAAIHSGWERSLVSFLSSEGLDWAAMNPPLDGGTLPSIPPIDFVESDNDLEFLRVVRETKEFTLTLVDGVLQLNTSEGERVGSLKEGDRLVFRQPAAYYNLQDGRVYIYPDSNFESLSTALNEALEVRSTVSKLHAEVWSSVGGKINFHLPNYFINGWAGKSAEFEEKVGDIRQLISLLKENSDYKSGALSKVNLYIRESLFSLELTHPEETPGLRYLFLELDSVSQIMDELAVFMRGVVLLKDINGHPNHIDDSHRVLTLLLDCDPKQLPKALKLLEEINGLLNQKKYSDFSVVCMDEVLKEGVDPDDAEEYFLVRIKDDKKVIEIVHRVWFSFNLPNE